MMLVLRVLSEMVRDNEAAETEVELMLAWASKETNSVINSIANTVAKVVVNELTDELMDAVLDVVLDMVLDGVVELSGLVPLILLSVLSDAWDG